MKFGLSEDSIKLIHDILKKYPEVEKAIIYGSRAKGNFKIGSDIDLTLLGKDLSYRTQSSIVGDLDDSSSPYLFDISIFDKLNSPSLEEHIHRVGKVFYQKDSSE
jgi:predicted nucleotidyltransferase